MICPIDKNIVKEVVKKRPRNADKTTVGTLLSVCGSYGMAGAAVMSSRSALRSGAGLLKLCVPVYIYPIIAGAVPEAVFIPLKKISDLDVEKNLKYTSAVLCGCGLGISDDSRAVVRNLIRYSEAPLIFDADALNIIAEDISVLKAAKSEVVLTPHDREFARLLGCYPEMLKNKREQLASTFAKRNNVIVVLKGSKTIVAHPNGDVLFNEELGNPGMAVGGLSRRSPLRAGTLSKAPRQEFLSTPLPVILRLRNSARFQCCRPILSTACPKRSSGYFKLKHII